MKNYTHFSARASLALLGAEVQRKKMWEAIETQVHIRQKRAGYRPSDKLKDAWINLLSGGRGNVEINTRVRPDCGLQKAFGRTGCAEQSTVSRCLSACTPENVAQMRQAIHTIFRQHSRSSRHAYAVGWLWLDVDMTGLLAGRQAEGSSKGYFSGATNARGRQVGRVWVSNYDEIAVDRLYPGKFQLERCLQGLLLEAEALLELEEAKRSRTVVRFDGGGGRDQDVNWLLERGYRILGKVKNWQRSQKLLQRVQQWYPDPQDASRQLGWVEPAQVYARPTRQIGVRDTHPDGKTYAYVLVTNLSDELVTVLPTAPPVPSASPADQLSRLAHLYDLRSGGIETANRNSKSGLGLHKRNKRSFAAQEMLLLLAQLAYLVLSWFYTRLQRTTHRFAGYGCQRLVRDVLQIPGKLSFDRHNQLIAIILSREHLLSRELVAALKAPGDIDDFSLILRKI